MKLSFTELSDISQALRREQLYWEQHAANLAFSKYKDSYRDSQEFFESVTRLRIRIDAEMRLPSQPHRARRS